MRKFWLELNSDVIEDEDIIKFYPSIILKDNEMCFEIVKNGIIVDGKFIKVDCIFYNILDRMEFPYKDSVEKRKIIYEIRKLCFEVLRIVLEDFKC